MEHRQASIPQMQPDHSKRRLAKVAGESRRALLQGDKRYLLRPRRWPSTGALAGVRVILR